MLANCFSRGWWLSVRDIVRETFTKVDKSTVTKKNCAATRRRCAAKKQDYLPSEHD